MMKQGIETNAEKMQDIHLRTYHAIQYTIIVNFCVSIVTSIKST